MKKRRLLLLAALFALLAAGPAAIAHHPDHSQNKELFPGEGVLPADQHGSQEGHLPPVDRNVRLVGKAEVFSPAGTGNEGRVADVSAYGDYAFLTAFRDPTCERAGAHVIDISNPRRPSEVRRAFMETTPQNYEGGLADDQANQTHSQFAWTNKFTNRTYVVLIDDEEFTDLDILDITDPRNPVLVNDTLDLNEPPFEVDQDSPSNLTDSFSHDMIVKRIGKRYVMS